RQPLGTSSTNTVGAAFGTATAYDAVAAMPALSIVQGSATQLLLSRMAADRGTSELAALPATFGEASGVESHSDVAPTAMAIQSQAAPLPSVRQPALELARLGASSVLARAAEIPLSVSREATNLVLRTRSDVLFGANASPSSALPRTAIGVDGSGSIAHDAAVGSSGGPWGPLQRTVATPMSSPSESRLDVTSAPESPSNRSSTELRQITERLMRTLARQLEVERERRGGRQRIR
ncbi:MAG TPA: hypothetical protein VIV60_18420, partial [Polyangiaceae bacterium]